MPPSTSRASTSVPVWRTSLPASVISASRPAVTGGIRWRCTPHVREWSVRKRRLSSSSIPCQSWAVTGRSPSIAARQSPVSSTVCVDVRVHDVTELVEGGDAGDAGRRRDGGSRGQAVHLGDEVVARHGVQGATGPVGGDGEVDHGEAGADQQQVAVGQLLGPGVADQPVRRLQRGRRPVGAGPGAGGQHDRAGDDRLAGGEPDHEAVTATVDAEHGLGASLEPGVAGVLGRGLQQAGDVVAVHPAGDEVLRLGLGVVVGAHPAEEVLRVAREGAHPARRAR